MLIATWPNQRGSSLTVLFIQHPILTLQPPPSLSPLSLSSSFYTLPLMPTSI